MKFTWLHLAWTLAYSALHYMKLVVVATGWLVVANIVSTTAEGVSHSHTEGGPGLNLD